MVITPSGLYRDSLPTLMLLLDKAVSAVKDLNEPDNAIRANVLRTRKALVERGVAPDQAERMSAVRMFTAPSGDYGTGLDNVIRASNSWNTEAEVVDVYFNRFGHLFGQGFWGDSGGPVTRSNDGGASSSLGIDVFKLALKDVKAVLHSRSSNLYGTLDNDDVFQFLGGAAMAVRQVNGTSPQTLLVNLNDPARYGMETLDKSMGREMRTRYLNPAWINAQFKEGYAGARLISQVVDNLWGWQVTTPEAVDSAKWQEFFEVYVQDKHKLDVKKQFKDAKNTLALQAMVDRMLVAVNKGYWKAPAEVVAELNKVNLELIAEAGTACDRDSCSSKAVTQLAEQLDKLKSVKANGGFGLGASTAGLPAPSSAAAQPAVAADQPEAQAKPSDIVRGQQLKEQSPAEQVIEQLVWTYGWLILLVMAMGIGWQAWRTRREAQLSVS